MSTEKKENSGICSILQAIEDIVFLNLETAAAVNDKLKSQGWSVTTYNHGSELDSIREKKVVCRLVQNDINCLKGIAAKQEILESYEQQYISMLLGEIPSTYMGATKVFELQNSSNGIAVVRVQGSIERAIDTSVQVDLVLPINFYEKVLNWSVNTKIQSLFAQSENGTYISVTWDHSSISTEEKLLVSATRRDHPRGGQNLHFSIVASPECHLGEVQFLGRRRVVGFSGIIISLKASKSHL